MHAYQCMWYGPRCTEICCVRKFADARVLNYYAYGNCCDFSQMVNGHFPLPFLCVLLLLSLKKCCCDWQHSRIDWDMFQFSRSLGGMRNTSLRQTLYNLTQHPIDNAATNFAVTVCFSLLVARMCARSCISTTWSSAWRTRTSQSWRQRPLVLVQVRQLWIDDFVKK